MNRLRLIICCICSTLILLGCSQVLEPISFYGKVKQSTEKKQEEFSINIKPLTFSVANETKHDPYTRNIMRNGSGFQANVLKEVDLLETNLPPQSKYSEYQLGVGDEITLTLQSEFLNYQPKFPINSSPEEYLLGVGDELKFVQQHTKTLQIQSLINTDPYTSDEAIIKSQGIIGSNGNILLLGLGNVNMGNRTLDDVRNEIRNILIREGLAPNFQLEISSFKSKTAYLTSTNGKDNIIKIGHIPITLRQLALMGGALKSLENMALITLIRDKKEYRMTAKQLWGTTVPEIYIQDKDNINIKILSEDIKKNSSVIDSKGQILLENIGTIHAEGDTLKQLTVKIGKILSKKGLSSNFRVDITGFNSKKAYLLTEAGSSAIPLTDKRITLRELVLKNNSAISSKSDLSLYILHRNDKKFQISSEYLLSPKTQEIIVQDGDQINLERLKYKPGQVFALSGIGNANIVSIDPSNRETLADVLFVDDGALINSFAQRSEVYLLRGKNPVNAYHLDTQNVSRILIAAKTELRPNDIIFVAERPIISFNRVLSEINPLRILLRDIQNNNFP